MIFSLDEAKNRQEVVMNFVGERKVSNPWQDTISTFARFQDPTMAAVDKLFVCLFSSKAYK